MKLVSMDMAWQCGRNGDALIFQYYARELRGEKKKVEQRCIAGRTRGKKSLPESEQTDNPIS
jgi:hypothetical protein